MRVLTFSGVLLDTGEMQLEPGFVTEAEKPSSDGEVTVEALDRGGRALATTQVPLVVPCGYAAANGAEHPPAVAVGLVDFPEKASGLRVTYDGRTLLEREAPRPGGEPKVEWPAAIEGPEVTVRWSARADGASASLAYSDDGGETWSPLSLPGTDEAITFDARGLPGGKRCLLELVASDGFHTTRSRSPEYQVEPKGWVLWILSPAPGATFRAGSPVLLAAQAFHLEERRPASDPIVWTSSRDGGLGEGAQVPATLSQGEHTITAAVAGASAEVSVTVER
jgi:hypothetical protein